MEAIKQRDFANIPVMWEPNENSGRRIKAFMKKIQEKYSIKFDNYWDLHKWSIENLEKFWAEIWNEAAIIHSKPYNKVIDPSIPMEKSPEWFEGSLMNIAENIMKFRDDKIAIIAAGEDKPTKRITYAELYKEVERYAAAMRKHGVTKGDRIACVMSNREEAVYAMLGATSIGAMWLGALPLMGPQAILNRFKQVAPKMLITVDRFPHNGEENNMLPKLIEVTHSLPSLEKVIIVPTKPESKLKDISGIKNSCFLNDFLESGKNENGSIPPMVFEQVPLSHPVFIGFTSGTTGLPKILIHHSGCLLAGFRNFWLHADGDRTDSWLSMSPVGWVSWNQFTMMLSLGVTIVLFEGHPYFLSPTYFWDMVDEFKISNLILTPSILDEFQKRGYVATQRHHLKSLKYIICGGSVVKAQNCDFVYQKIKPNIIFSSVYGSTEVNGGSMMVETTLKIYYGETNAPALGEHFEVLDDSGNSVVGDIGELVMTKTSPSLTSGIWGDTDNKKFKKSYFEKFPGKFTVGDLALINPVTKGFAMCGRSDETLKQRGCRFGSSEIYNIVDKFPEVLDSICVSQYSKNLDERAVLFLKMRPGFSFGEELVRKLREVIADELTIRHIPEVILETKEIPYNINGKKIEIIVKKIINKMSYNADMVMNPECLKNFMDVPELRDFEK